MLVLTRKQDQEVVIDDVIRVRVLSIEGNRVRLGFEAPSNVKIDREEVHRYVTQEFAAEVPFAGESDCADSDQGVVLQL